MSAVPRVPETGPIPTTTVDARLVASIAAELGPGLAGRCTSSDLNAIVAGAVHDLTGSIAAEALPEMAARLAAVRATGSEVPVHIARRSQLPRSGSGGPDAQLD